MAMLVPTRCTQTIPQNEKMLNGPTPIAVRPDDARNWFTTPKRGSSKNTHPRVTVRLGKKNAIQKRNSNTRPPGISVRASRQAINTANTSAMD